MKRKATRDPLKRLVKQADSVAKSAEALANETLDKLRGQLARFAKKSPNVAGSAAARDIFYKSIKRETKILSERIDTLQQRLVTSAGKRAAEAAAHTTGLDVRYSDKRAKAISELVTPAQGENLAAVFTDKMSETMISALREATVQSLREQGAAGGSLKDQSRDLMAKWSDLLGDAKPTFVDASGKTWDAERYLQMNVRTNAMRVYNDCLVDDIARVSPSEHPLAMISSGGDADCACSNWEGQIVSIDGSDKRFPSYEDARAGGCFHPNCVHTLEYVDPDVDEDEINLQAKHPPEDGKEGDADAQDDRKYEIDQDRYRQKGMGEEEARRAVDRDNLETAIRTGMIEPNARKIVDALTNAQVDALCPNGNPPRFEPTKRGEEEKRVNGSRGGAVHIKRDGLSAERLVEVARIDEQKAPSEIKVGEDGAKYGRLVSFDDLTQSQAEAATHMSESGMNENAAVEVAARLPDAVLENSKTVKFEFDGDAYHLDGVVHLSKNKDSYDGCPAVIAHELGHAWWHKNGFKNEEKTKALSDALKSDWHDIEQRMKKALGDDWKDKCTPSKIVNEVSTIATDVLGFEKFSLMFSPPEDRAMFNGFLDMMMAATGGELGYGHNPKKMRNIDYSTHEVAAHCSRGHSVEKFREIFPNAMAAFDKMTAVDSREKK